MAKQKYNKQRFDIKLMTQQEGYTVINNLLFKYQDKLGLDFTDLGIICKICAFSPDFTINFSKHFSSMTKRTRTTRLNKLLEKGYITTKKTNIKTNEGIRSGGLLVSIEPLVEILNNLFKSEGEEKDTINKSHSAKIAPLTPVDSAKIAPSNNTNKYYTNNVLGENRLGDLSPTGKEEKQQKTEEDWLKEFSNITFKPEMTDEELKFLDDLTNYLISKGEKEPLYSGEMNRIVKLKDSCLPFWKKPQYLFTDADKKANEFYKNTCRLNKDIDPKKDNMWLFYGDEPEDLIRPDEFQRLFRS